jgi:RNA polymerase sigma-70 factor (ECF subfamily)
MDSSSSILPRRMYSLPDTRHSLLVRLADPADIAAWSEFTEIYADAIYRYSRSRGLQDSDAREVVQEVLLVVHREVGSWRSSGRSGSFRAWLIETARRVCLRSIRNRARRDRATGGSSIVEKLLRVAGPADEDDDRDWERWAFCWAAGQIEREIEAATWRAFWLTAVEAVPPGEAAERLGMKIGSIYAAKCRVLARIRERVREISETER